MKLTKREPTYYDLESARIKQALTEQTPGTDEYNKLLDEMEKLRKFTGEERDMKRIIDKKDRGPIIGKLLGIGAIGAMIFGLCKFEKSGNMLSGSSGEGKSGLLKAAFKLLG